MNKISGSIKELRKLNNQLTAENRFLKESLKRENFKWEAEFRDMESLNNLTARQHHHTQGLLQKEKEYSAALAQTCSELEDKLQYQ